MKKLNNVGENPKVIVYTIKHVDLKELKDKYSVGENFLDNISLSDKKRRLGEARLEEIKEEINSSKVDITCFCKEDLKVGDEVSLTSNLFRYLSSGLVTGFVIDEIVENRQHKGVLENEKAFYKLKLKVI